MGCFHGQAIGDCLACDIGEAFTQGDAANVAPRLVQNASALLEERDALRSVWARFRYRIESLSGTESMTKLHILDAMLDAEIEEDGS